MVHTLRRNKKIAMVLTILMALCMVLGSFPAGAFAQDEAPAPTYEATVSPDIAGGKLEATPTAATPGDTVTVAVTPDEGYVLTADSLAYTTAGAKAATPIQQTEGAYQFTMPEAAVTITAQFQATEHEVTEPEVTQPEVTQPEANNALATKENTPEPAAAPTFTNLNGTLTGENLTFTLQGIDDKYGEKITKVAVTPKEGKEQVLVRDTDYRINTKTQKETTVVSITFLRTDENPIFDQSVDPANPKKTLREKQYDIKIEATGYQPLAQKVTLKNYGAKSFQVRRLDANGKVLQKKSYTLAQLKELGEKKDQNYQTYCGMAGLRTFKADGVLLTDILADAKIDFKPGMTLKLRTNDKAKTENDSTTDNAYFFMGNFTQENLMKPRYYFPAVFHPENTTLIEAMKNGTFVSNPATESEATRQALGGSDGKNPVTPLIAWDYDEKVFKSDQTAPSQDNYSKLISNERGFRFLYGIAMEDGKENETANEMTTMSATYALFGVDIIDPGIVNLVGYKVWNTNGNITETMNPSNLDNYKQNMRIQLKFDGPISITSQEDVLKQLNIAIDGHDEKLRDITVAVNKKDNTILDITLNQKKVNTGTPEHPTYPSVKQTASKLAITLADSNAFTAITNTKGDPVKWNMTVNTIIPTGLQIKEVTSVTGTADKPASVTYKLTSVPLVRSMNFLQPMSNGNAIVTDKGSEKQINANYLTIHSHYFFDPAKASAAIYIKELVNAAKIDTEQDPSQENSLYSKYLLTGEPEKNQFTLTAKDNTPKEKLSWQVYAYPNITAADLKYDLSVAIDNSKADSKKIAAAKAVLYNQAATVTDIQKAVKSVENTGGGSTGGGSTGGGSGSGSSTVTVPTYTVTFDSQGGSSVTSQKIEKNKTVSQPAKPTKTGYTFAGWYTDKACTKVFDFDTKITAATTLYAKWAKGEAPAPENTNPAATNFTDVPANHWAKASIDYLVEKGIVNGKTATTFAPNDNITRAEFVKILAGIAGINPADYTSSDFTDVAANAWYAPYAAWAKQTGVAQGTDGKFNPNAAITRQEMAAMTARFATDVKKAELPTVNAAVTFTDSGQIAAYAKDAVSKMQQAGIINGKDNGSFAPLDNATRAEAAKMLAAFMQTIN